MSLIIYLIILVGSCYSIPINYTLGGCMGTEFKCCPNNITACTSMNCTNCEVMIGGCMGTEFKCCPNNITACTSMNCTNC